MFQRSHQLIDEFLINSETEDLVQVTPNLYISNASTATNKTWLKEKGITHIVNLSSTETAKKHPEFDYLDLKLRDTPESNILMNLSQVTKFLDGAGINSPGEFLIAI